jgi:hypothetical protein
VIGGYLLQCHRKSAVIFAAGLAFREFCGAVAGYSSFASTINAKAFGEPRFMGGVH